MNACTHFFMTAALALVAASGAVAQETVDTPPPAFDFQAIDQNMDEAISLTEWLSWFATKQTTYGLQDDTLHRPDVTIVDAEGNTRVLRAKPVDMSGELLIDYSAENYSQDRITSPIAARKRLLEKETNPMASPDFYSYDLDQNGFISPEEFYAAFPANMRPLPSE